MATTIKTKNSTTGSTVPTGLVQGELAVNITDKKLYVGDAVGNSVQIAGQGATNAAGGSNTQVQYNSSGALAGSANMTFSGTALTLANDASISGLTVGKGGGAVSTNTAVGASALGATNTGGYVTAVGYQSSTSSTSATRNASFGWGSLRDTTSGADLAAYGFASLIQNTTGSSNTGLGSYALYSNTTASSNTAVGYRAGYTNSTGSNNVFVGNQAGELNSTGGGLTFVGNGAGLANTASNNTGLGFGVMVSNTTGTQNTAVGGGQVGSSYGTLQANTTGSYNTAIGFYAGYTNSTGTQNCFIGHSAGYYVSTGSKNTILGSYNGNQGGLDIRTASNYIVLSDGDGNPRLYGNNSGHFFINGPITDNAFLNIGADLSSANALALKDLGTTYGSGSTYQVFYNSSNSVAGSIQHTATTTVNYNTSSDERLKEDKGIATDTSVIDNLKIHNFVWKSDSKEDVGVFAQEAHQVKPSAVYVGKDDLTEDGNLANPWGVDYSKFVPDLVVHAQQLKKMVQELKAEVDSLKQQLGK